MVFSTDSLMKCTDFVHFITDSIHFRANFIHFIANSLIKCTDSMVFINGFPMHNGIFWGLYQDFWNF
jgi:hypothetical protein